MKITRTIPLISKGEFAKSKEWEAIRDEIRAAIETAEWPAEKDQSPHYDGKFTIYPESGKKSGKGNGVVPIKAKPMKTLKEKGWQLEAPWTVTSSGDSEEEKPKKKGSKPGGIDAAKTFPQGTVAVEWETGNISSSHRALNKMTLGLIEKNFVGGVLVVPEAKLAKYLTDRIGNADELAPYVPLYEHVDTEGVLELVVIEQDAESLKVPKIPKGKDGRAKEAALKTIEAGEKKAAKAARDEQVRVLESAEVPPNGARKKPKS
jgi:hypothetical protein